MTRGETINSVLPIPGDREPITIFIASFGRPIYLWSCLDSLWRCTRSPKRIVLLDNAHPDPLVGDVIAAFERRGLFADVRRFATNEFANIKTAYRAALEGIGPLHVYMESDVVVCERDGCWLGEMRRVMEHNPNIGMLGSLIDPRDFVPQEVAMRLTGGDQAAARGLAKLASPERVFIDDETWSDPRRDFFPTEPPCPLGNAPGRLVMLRTDVMRETGFQLDTDMAADCRRRGLISAITPRVRHRHLSLLNIYDYQDYGPERRNQFFRPDCAGGSR